MKLIQKGQKKSQVWRGTCKSCGAIYEADRAELDIEHCIRESYEFAHHGCPECGSPKGSAVIFYPAKD